MPPAPSTEPYVQPPLSPAQRAKVRRLARPVDPAPGEEAGELNVIPYLDIIVNILVFVLVSVTTTFLSTLETTPPSIGGGKVRADVSQKSLSLSVLITGKGIGFKTSGGNVATGCDTVGSGITIPMRTSKSEDESPYDLSAVTACARKLKSARPEFEEERKVTITANPAIEYHHVIDVIDALDKDDRGELFPEIYFGVVR